MSEFHKSGVSLDEYHMHQYVYDLNIVNVPKIISYDKDTQILVMQRLNSDPDTEINESLQEKDRFDDIRDIIRALYDNNIEYPDITSQNFIESGGKLWVVNFEHARHFRSMPILLTQEYGLKDPFVKRFISRNLYQWNPRFLICSQHI